MATQNISIGVNVSDNGTAKKVVKNFEEITQAASTAQKTAQGISAPQGGTPGSRAVYAKSAPAGSQQLMSGQEYGNARGSANATGASARDFANQAQGLGGLVRLYATYAANLFAVSAAFTALSNAMDTSNMVRGLDQLGAASGVALGSLSKELVKATDGAISLRDAMTATAKASSSGMNSEQILRMGKVAQQASQALGVDMADAISRISRGITKLEPELLDELGLFTKTGKAAEDYAKKVGKSVTELTDFERRASFANAVLEEGEKKFSQIKLDVNPYTKLLASIKDLAQVSLEFLNKGLAPIVAYLSNSPTALGVAIAALGTVLVKQALPALGEFKAGLASTADRANQISIQKAQDAAKARLAIDTNILAKVEGLADDKVAAVDAAEQKIRALEASGLNKRSAAYKLLQKDITEVTQADIAAVEKRAKIAEKSGDAKRAAAYREVSSAVLEQKNAEEDLIITKQNLSKQLEKDAAGMTTYGMTIRAAEKAQTAALNANIVSNTAYNGSLIGVTGSIALMRAEMQAAGIATNTFAGRMLLARGALAALGGAVSTVMGAFGPLMLLITGISLVFSLLDGAMSKNNKESNALSESLDKLDANADHLGKTLDTLNQKPFLDRMSPESLKVKATALGEVSAAISSTINDLLKADKAASGWDKFINGFKTLWDGDTLSKTSKTLATGITSSLANIAGSTEAKTLNKELSSILKIDTETATFQEVQDALKKIGQEAPEKLKLVQEGFNKISLASQVTAAKGTELVDAFKKLNDIKQTINNKFLPTDDVTKFGQELAATSQKLSIALEDPQQKLNAIIQLGANAISIPNATFEQVSALSKAADLAKNIQVLEAKQLENKQKLLNKQEEISKLIGKDSAASIAAGKQTQVSGLTQEGIKQLDKLTKDFKELKSTGEINLKVKTELTSKLQGYSKEIETATLATYKTGADIVAKQISAEFIKAGKVVSDAYVSIIGETEATIKIKADSEKAVVSAQIQQIMSQRDLTIATRELSLQLQKKSLEDYLQNNREGREGVQVKLAALEPQIQAIEAAKTGDFSKLKLSTGSKDLKNLNVEADSFAQNMQASAAAVGNLRAQIKAIDIGALDASTRVKFEPQKKSLETQQKSVEIAKQELDIQGKIVTQGNLAFLNAKQSLDTEQLRLQQDTALLDNKVQIARQQNIIDDNGSSQKIKAAAESKKTELLTAQETLKTQQQQQKTNLASSQVQEKLNAFAFNAEESRKREAENAELALGKKSEELKIQESLFSAYSSIGLLSETQKIKQKFLLEQKSAELDYEQKIAQVKSSDGQQLGALDAREKAIRQTLSGATEGTDDRVQREELAKIAETRALIVARTSEEAIAAGKVRDNTLGIASAIKTAGLEQERFNQLLENSGALAESLGAAFGDVGSKLGSLAESLAKIVVSTAQGSKSLEKIGKDADSAWSTGNIDRAIELESDYEKQKKKNNKTELDGNIKVISGTKSLFKEKTGAYRVLNAMEKAMHTQKMIMFAAENGAELLKTAIAVGSSLKRMVTSTAEAGVDGTAAVVNQGKGDPYTAFARMAAMAAFIASLTGKSSGGGGGFVPTAEQRQETQGTAMSYDSAGNKVQTRRGVFGDTDAKSESIANSLEIIKDNSVKGLDYDDKMLRSLQNLTNALDNTAKGLYGVKGLSAGSLSGVTEGTNTGKGFLGIGGLFSKSTTKSIVDSGLQLKGSFLDLANGVRGTINTFETVSTTVKKSGFFGLGASTRTSVSTNFKDLGLIDPKAFEALTNAFGYASDLLYQIADTAGKDAASVTNAIANIQIDQMASLRGLTGEEFTKELSAIVGSVLDDASLVIFAEYEKFAKFGEGMLETVLRVVDTNKKVLQQLSNLNNLSTSSLSIGQSSLQITENLVKLAGGLSNFLDQSNYFSENFLTEAERVVPTQKAVVKQLANLGYASVDTKAEFKTLVQSLDLTTASGQQTYQSLMELAPGFIEVIELAESQAQALKDAAQSFRDFSKSLLEFKSSLLLGASNLATPTEKYLLAKAEFEATYTKALAGDKDAQGKFQSAATTFLDSSKVVNASSEAYQKDFNSVLQMIDTASSSSLASASVAELQLNALSIHTSLLSSINTNIAAIAGVPGLARGGRASGLTLVGELGPELVDFSMPGRVYSADQTAGMFTPMSGNNQAMGAVVVELQQLRQEVVQLRKDQQKQTGDLIISNYDANQKASEEVATAVVGSSKDTLWKTRSKSEIK